MIFSKGDWKTFQKGIEKEWLLTNGLGSFASSTIIGANTRRYHGLLVASFRYPVKRHLIISKFDETVQIGDISYNLAANQTPGYINPGFQYLQSAEIDKLPTFTYNVQDVFIEKKISMVYGKNTVAVVYRVVGGIKPVVLRITPLVNFREYHGNTTSSGLSFKTSLYENGIILKPDCAEVNIEIKSSEGIFKSYINTWFYSMDYFMERERGLNSIEDHYMPGCFEITVDPGQEKVFTIVGSVDGIDTLDGLKIIQEEEARLEGLIKKAGYNDQFSNALVMAADKFIVYRQSTDAKSIIAGYPWFTDWGRDTMVSLPGLTLVTKRFEDAKEILISFTKYIRNGLVPNMFPDEGREPVYNTVDASLWFIEATYKFLKYTKQYSFVKEEIYPHLKEIIECYKNGTDFNIKMDIDGLISAGSQGTQLTWMDAKVGEWVVTPRQGKAVEINALWYNALKIMDILAIKFGDENKGYQRLASKVKKSFVQFWNEKEECLYDVIDVSHKDEKVRPNQIFALSLSYPVLDGEKAKKVLNKVLDELYTAFGLRSLSPNDKDYRGIYIGDQLKRDSSYHEGTVWGWLIGPFITAYLRVNNHSEESKRLCRKIMEPFSAHLRDAGIGLVSEIFDGNDPNNPRGCYAQAWSVAEVLRVYIEDVK